MIRTTRRFAARGELSEMARFEAVEPRILLDGVPMAIADPSDQVEVVFANNGEMMVYSEGEGGEWTSKDLGGWIPESLRSVYTPTSAANWRDPKDGRAYHAFNSPQALALILDDDHGRIESIRLLSEELEDAEPISSGITSFTSTEGLVHIAGVTAAGDVVVYRQTGARDPMGAYAWEFINISRDHLTPQGQATPVFASDLVSYVTAWNGLNIAGLDENGEVRAVWWAPGLEQWQTSNLSEQTGAPPLEGGLSVYLTSWDGINIAGTKPSGELVVAWWVPQFGGDWAITNFADEFGGPRLTPGTVMAYTTPWGGLNVGGVDLGTGGLSIYWWVPEFEGQWQVAGNLVPDAEAFSSGGVYGFTSSAGTINLIGTSDGGDVIRYAWQPGGSWRSENISSASTPVLDDLDDNDNGPIIPRLESLAGTWSVRFHADLYGEVPEDEFGEPGLITLRADGSWIGDNDHELNLSAGFGPDVDRGTWTYGGGVVTLSIPEFGSTRATGVLAGATQFRTRGISLMPEAREELELSIDEYDAMFPGENLRGDIEAAGGLVTLFNSFEVVWTRV